MRKFHLIQTSPSPHFLMHASLGKSGPNCTRRVNGAYAYLLVQNKKGKTTISGIGACLSPTNCIADASKFKSLQSQSCTPHDFQSCFHYLWVWEYSDSIPLSAGKISKWSPNNLHSLCFQTFVLYHFEQN